MELVTYPHPALLKKALPVDTIDEDMQSRIDEMLEIMRTEDGVGLAAPQVAWSVRLLVMSPGQGAPDDQVLINPVIKKRRGRVLGEEGCLSFPGIFVQVERAREIDIKYLDRNGKEKRETLVDFPARVAQHEMDHLENILLVHRMSPADRIRVKRDLQNLARQDP